MNATNEKRFELQYDELDLLAWNTANEVINGFRVENFHEQIGTSLEDFRRVAVRLRSTPSTEAASLTMSEARAFRNALAITLEELGEDEFETRTGHNFDKGNVLLRRLEKFLKGEDQT
jgi:hypothetical protein